MFVAISWTVNSHSAASTPWWPTLTMAGAHEGRELATVARTQGSAEVHQWRWVQKDVEDLGTKIHRSLEVDCAPPKYDKQIDE
jgi:hypothetical protein